jgi:hypothetical protein
MLNLRKAAATLIAAAAMAAAQPALTTIQDILYRADGTRFSGTIFIAWDSFQAGDTSNIATSSLTLPIINGVLNVQLVPTTTASAGAQYKVTFNGKGVNQFTQVWAVPPSSIALRVRDVLVSQGTVIGPTGGVVSPVQISDVVGLENELAIRPQEGVGFTIGRTAVINTSGQIDGAAGNLSDCVRVDGSSGPCGGGGLLPSFSDGEIPAGTINGTNLTFTLANTPSPVSSLAVYLNGLRMTQAVDYSVDSNAITFISAAAPQPGDVLTASYRYANPSNPLGTLTAAQVICSAPGGSTSNTSATALATCTIPAGLLGQGDRIEIQAQYSHTGSSAGFTVQVNFGTATVLARSANAVETALVGRVGVGLGSATQSWSVQSWGNTLGFSVGAGTATQNILQNLTIYFYGNVSTASSDTIGLSNFTVIRYPAQINP